ncbi:MAG: hypothetical protein M3Q07_22130 [Pseudobdellovibrionaceae bacterium]|nr:hypothetical protein [Pseudobdellovibrionaceae bacterium]
MHHPDFILKRITSLLFLVVWESPGLAHVKSPEPVVKPLEIMVEDAAPPWSGADGKGYANDVVKDRDKALVIFHLTLGSVPFEPMNILPKPWRW